ncbi:hypothetical protein [Deinococcus sp.]|uniref:hypothetical protein n=1 Tax=Deinococcus sp. TaxID=47478 RepID=UPI002869C761|nr:hypothetical protein [Deinococcus sp.]
MTAVATLSPQDQRVIAECMTAILSGVFIDDAEFQTTAGSRLLRWLLCVLHFLL